MESKEKKTNDEVTRRDFVKSSIKVGTVAGLIITGIIFRPQEARAGCESCSGKACGEVGCGGIQ